MIISRNILEFINPTIKDIPNKALANILMALGIEIEQANWKYNPKDFENLVFGKIINIEKIEKSRSLSLCTVEIFNSSLRCFEKSSTYEIVCGADNLKNNSVVIIALPSQTLPNGMRIEKRRIFNILSNGMICSLDELGIKNSLRHSLDGVFLASCKNSKLYKDLLDGKINAPIELFNDYQFEVTTVYNSHFFQNQVLLANWISWFFKIKKGGRIKLHNSIDINAKPICFHSENAQDHLVIAKDLKNHVDGIMIKTRVSEVKKAYDLLELKILSSMISLGYNLINKVVNYLNLMSNIFGQPMHIYDYSTLKEHKITIKQLGKTYVLPSLLGKDINLENNDVVVERDDYKILALPSIIGSKEFATTANEEYIYIEMLSIDTKIINKTTTRLGINNPTTLLSKKYKSKNFMFQAQLFFFNKLSYVKKLYDINVNNTWLVNNLGLQKKDLIWLQKKLSLIGIKWEINQSKWSIVTIWNLFEWVRTESDFIQLCYLFLMYFGYSNKNIVSKKTYNESLNSPNFINSLRLSLQQVGYTETNPYLLTSIKKYSLFNWDDTSKKEKIEVLSEINYNYKRITMSLITPLLDILQKNKNFGEKNVKIYANEILPTTFYTFARKLALIWYHEKHFSKAIYAKIYTLILKIIHMYTNQPIKIGNIKLPIKSDLLNQINNYNTQIFKINKSNVAIVGEINPILLLNYRIETGTTYFAELDLSKLESIKSEKEVFGRMSKHPNIEKDLTFLFSKETNFLEICSLIETLDVIDHAWIDEVYFDNMGISITYKISIFQFSTISSDYLNQILQNIVSLVLSKYTFVKLKGSL